MGVRSSPAPVGTPSNPTWLSLFRFTAKRHLPVLFLGVFLAVAASLTTPAMAVLLGNIFNTFTLFGAGSISDQSLVEKVTSGCVGLACLGAVSWALNASYFTLFIIYGELQASSSRGKLFEELLKRNLEWFETQQDGTGAFLSSLQAQMGELRTATSQPLGLVLQFSFRSVASLGLGLYTSWNLTLVTLAGIPVFSSMIAFLSTRMKRNIHAQETELNHVSKIANSATTSIDTVKCLNGQEFEYRNFVSRVDNAAVHYLKQARFNSLQITIIRVMMFAMFVQGFWYGSSLATSGKLSAGDVLRTFWACLTAAQSIELVLPQVIVLEKGKIAATALGNVISDQSGNKTVNEMKGTLYPRHCEGDIEVNDMSFCYSSQPDALILRSANFFFPAGETTFVIGKSGSGKSTLGQLLTRFYLPESGDILIDGNPIQDLSVNWIRNNVTLIEQRSVLFDESVFTNIAFGRRDYDRVKKKDVQKCIELAMLQTVIDTLPSGIDTCVGSGGNLLSGGQRQRVAIGRARLRDTPILIMDEPTSALDGTNRAAVMKAIREWRKGKTTIVITHDMSQIQPRDFVYILEQGAIMESGYRHELENNPMNEKYFDIGGKAAPLDETQGIDDCAATDKASIPEVYLDTSSVSSVESLPDIEPGQPYFQSTRANARPLSSYRNTRPLSSRHSYVERDPFARFSGIPLHDLNSIQTQNTNAAAVPFQPRPMSTAQPSQPLEVPSRRASVKQYRRRRRKSDKKKSKGPSLRQILWTIVPNISAAQRVFLTIGFVCSLAHATSIPVFSYCLAQVFGSFYATTDNSHTAMRWSLAVLGVAIADGIVSFFMHYCLEISGQAWVDCLRKKGFSRVLDQPRVWFEKETNRPYKLTACFDQNGEDMKNLVGRFAGFVLVAVAILIMAIVWSLVVCWKLALVVLACGPVIFAITRGFERTSGVWENRCSEASRIISGIFVETFSEIRTVRTLTLESFFHRKHMKAASKCTTVGFKKAGYTGVLFGLVESTVIFVSALIFYYGSILVSSREFTVSDVVTVFSMLLFSVGYASSLMSFIPQISTSQERASQLLRLADLPEGASHEHLGSMRMIKTAPVKFNKVDFRYPSRPDALILKDVSITIPRGCCTAIVGRSGSGKSTIASLLLSLYEAPLPHVGDPSISLGGIDIRRLHTPTLRSMVSIVSQQPTIFPGTIHANIAYGLDETSPLCSAHSVTNAARAAGVDDFISSLPRGYTTLVGEGGVGLSGGQAQRIVIARALVRRPQILILDEATSALDPSSAELIKQTVQELVAVRRHELTVIIITHAKEMMEIADNIVVLEQGSVVEEGPYRVLAGRGGGKLRMLLEGEDDEED